MKRANTFACLFLSLCFTLMWGCIIQHGYSDSRRRIYKKVEVAFNEAIEEDARLWKMKLGIITHEVPAHDSCLIPSNERIMHAYQEIIINRVPKRHSLDSLFCLKMAEQEIQAQCAIRCISQFGVTNSSSDSLFYRKSVQLPSVIYRPMVESWRNRVELQAYVQIPFLFILKQIPTLEFMVFLSLLINVVLLNFYWYWPKYKQKMLTKNRTIEIRAVVEEKVVEVQKLIPVKSFTKKNVFPSGFLFDKSTGIINYNGQTVQLTGQKLKLFCYFLNMKQSVLTNEDIGKHMYNLDESASGLPGRISMAVARLRESLAPFPFIQIEAVRGTGYQLIITQSD